MQAALQDDEQKRTRSTTETAATTSTTSVRSTSASTSTSTSAATATATATTTTTPAHSYELEIVQQPVRARMCGLGDKDRRLISPPPFVKLVVREASSGKSVPVQEVDASSFVLLVELWSADGYHNLSLSQNIEGSDSLETASSPVASQQPPASSSPTKSPSASPIASPIAFPIASAAAAAAAAAPISSMSTPTRQASATAATTTTDTDSDDSVGSVPTRNLIGSLVVNAFKLFDEHDERGIWFVLSDLSVRIEGEFRLRLLFTDLAMGQERPLVTIFSDVFKVYSAKRFPGVVDSSALGRIFANQGVKIPVRRDYAGK